MSVLNKVGDAFLTSLPEARRRFQQLLELLFVELRAAGSAVAVAVAVAVAEVAALLGNADDAAASGALVAVVSIAALVSTSS